MPSIFLKDPEAILDYMIDWTDWLAGDTIVSAVWTIPAGLTVVTDSHDNTTTTVWLSGGTLGTTYTGKVHIVTSAGREEDHTVIWSLANN